MDRRSQRTNEKNGEAINKKNDRLPHAGMNIFLLSQNHKKKLQKPCSFSIFTNKTTKPI